MPIPEGAVLETVSGTVDLQLHDKQILVHLQEGSRLKFKSIATGTNAVNTTLDLQRGSLFCIANELSVDSHLGITFFEGVAGIRGPSVFEAHASGLFRCQTGSIIVIYIIPGVLDSQAILKANTWSARSDNPNRQLYFSTNDTVSAEVLKNHISELQRLLPNSGETSVK